MRLLGYPRGLGARRPGAELADWARDWYAEHGRPWVYAREASTLALDADGVDRASTACGSPARACARRWSTPGAHRAVLVAVSAGPELEAEAQRRWQDEKPDEYFFLEVYGSAVVEHLVTMTGARLCALGRDAGRWPCCRTTARAIRSGTSPSRPRCSTLITASAAPLPGPLEVLDSGMLRPKKSLLAVFGLTRHVERVRTLTRPGALRELLVRAVPVPPGAVSPRRAAIDGARVDEPHDRRRAIADDAIEPPVLDRSTRATRVNAKALRRWAAER